ncbi:hypothetical protein BDW42DRAFT_200373 [Aspergillus taichungensis]|uniref:Uncharacterized protein n=1 Tax=Aspergillus taichungensis TaxID=482145 RepID=A0A2J5HYV4_9EURO|nr:hypothetical protein BDW42DRAFT_200373 [Aspergillus taichungensis]
MTTTVYDSAMQWAADQCSQVPGVALTAIPGLGLGMVATRVIEEDEALVTIHISIMLTIDCVPETFVELFPDRTSTHVILASFKSFMSIPWGNTLESTPVDGGKLGADHYPLPPAASGSWNAIEEDSTRNSFDDIYQNILSKQNHHWLVINTRSFYYVTPEKKETEDWNDAVGLAPIADYFNHASDEVGFRWPIAFTAHQQRTDSKSISEKGEEVYISYGSHPNDYLFVDYGFVPDHNPYDAIFLDDLILKTFTVSQLEELKARDLYGDYKITQDVPCPRTQDQEYALHRFIDTTDRVLMMDTIYGWVGTYLKECLSTIISLQSMTATSGHDNLELSTLLKR